MSQPSKPVTLSVEELRELITNLNLDRETVELLNRALLAAQAIELGQEEDRKL